MPRSLGRRPIAFSGRSQFKVRADQLVEDGEIRGLRVKRGEEDQEHPQKFLRAPGPDRINLYRPQPENYTSNVTIRYGLEAGSELWIKMPPQALQIGMGGFKIEIDGAENYISQIVTEGFALDESDAETITLMGFATG